MLNKKFFCLMETQALFTVWYICQLRAGTPFNYAPAHSPNPDLVPVSSLCWRSWEAVVAGDDGQKKPAWFLGCQGSEKEND